MSTINVDKGWLTDENGTFFAPNTLSSQIIKNDGESFENYILSLLENLNQNIENLELNLNGLKFMKVSSLPENPDENTVYFII